MSQTIPPTNLPTLTLGRGWVVVEVVPLGSTLGLDSLVYSSVFEIKMLYSVVSILDMKSINLIPLIIKMRCVLQCNVRYSAFNCVLWMITTSPSLDFGYYKLLTLAQ